MDPHDRETVDDITIDKAVAMTLVYADGEVCAFPVDRLRASCPCATCRGFRERGEVAWPRPGMSPDISIADAELTGAWGISIRWSDGHDTGIYAWRLLRSWWDSEFADPFVTDHAAGHVAGHVTGAEDL